MFVIEDGDVSSDEAVGDVSSTVEGFEDAVLGLGVLDDGLKSVLTGLQAVVLFWIPLFFLQGVFSVYSILKLIALIQVALVRREGGY